jgi:prostaglandin-endoperoxide synthase 2
MLTNKITNGVLEMIPWLGKRINKFAINSAVNVSRHRPHPWSTVHDYVSWTSLTDKHWSARHLPVKRLEPPKNDDIIIQLFQRPVGEQRLCLKSTCLFPAFAQYLTDGFIRTRMPVGSDPQSVRKQNTSNHEIDLSPLYGRTKKQTDALRLKSQDKGKKGKLKSQFIDQEEYSPFLYEGGSLREEFSDLDKPLMLGTVKGNSEIVSRLFAFGGDRVNTSPQIAMMNTLFLREHNRLAGAIEKSHPSWGDEQIFEIARNTNIVLFIKIVIEEYINHISPRFKFHTDPSVSWNASWNKPNWITTEFSLLYRWHPLIPDTMKWGDLNYRVDETIMNNSLFLDRGLKQSFIDMSTQASGQMGPFNTADALLHLEKMAIDQGRLCQLASYSDYRSYVGLSRPKDFSDISSNSKVVSHLREAYAKVDDIEFYVGLFSESVEPNSPLPLLISKLVATDAFSQALTNPLLSEHVWNKETFSSVGWNAINQTSSIRDILNRNIEGGLKDSDFVGMTQRGWKAN